MLRGNDGFVVPEPWDQQILLRRERRANHNKENSEKRTNSCLGRVLACDDINPCVFLAVRMATVGSGLSGVSACHVKCEANLPTGTPLVSFCQQYYTNRIWSQCIYACLLLSKQYAQREMTIYQRRGCGGTGATPVAIEQ